MTVGLRIRDNANNVTLELSDRITRYIGAVGTGTASGSVTDGRFASGNPWFHIVGGSTYNQTTVAPRVSISNNVLTWTYTLANGQTAMPVTIIYGVS